jgi:hypothetical protein
MKSSKIMKMREMSGKLDVQLAMAILAVATMVTGCTYDKVQPDVCFESEVLPIFVTYCSTSGCHNATDRVKDYDLTNYNGIMQGITPNRPGSSDLVQAMGSIGEDAMPPSGSPQPSATQIATIKAWVNAGAVNTTNCATVSCDTAAAVTFSGDLQPMLATNCNGCHSGGSAGAGLDLTVFATVQQNALNGRIQGAMSGDPNFKTMPPSGALLSSCYVTKIEKWVANGAPNN